MGEQIKMINFLLGMTQEQVDQFLQTSIGNIPSGPFRNRR
jgi:hypothetical protein